MKRILLAIMIAALSALLFACTDKPGAAAPEVSAKEQTIIEWALADIDETGDATLEYLATNNVAWIEWDCTAYILTVNGKAYYVGVQEKDGVVHFVDVVEELTPDDLATIKGRGF